MSFWDMVSGFADASNARQQANTQFQYQKKLMSYQNDLNKDYSSWNYSNASSLQRKGLESAGYNPILAVNNGSSFQGGSVGLGSVNVSDSNMFTNAYKSRTDRNAVNVQERAQRSQERVNSTQEAVNSTSAELNEVKASTETALQDNLKADTALKTINTELSRKDLSWRDRLNLNQIKTNIINSQANAGMAAAASTNAQSAVTNANTASYTAHQGSAFRYTADKVLNPLLNSNTGKNVSKAFNHFDQFITHPSKWRQRPNHIKRH